MIIRKKIELPEDNALIEMHKVGDGVVFRRVMDVSGALERAKSMREYSNNGWTKGKQFRHVGCIPASVFVQHPEFTNDPDLLIKFLKSEQGAPYRTVTKGL